MTKPVAIILVVQSVNFTSLENLSTTVRAAIYPAVAYGNKVTIRIVSYSKEFSALVRGYNNPLGT